MASQLPDPFDRTGTLLGHRYRLIRGIGAGASGQVYEACDVTDGERVAVKVLRERGAPGSNLPERFLREAKELRRVASPFVVRILDFQAPAKLPWFLVMEYLEGVNAGQLVARAGPLQQARLSVLADHIFCGIAAVHRAGVIHRDVKPHNVMVVEDEHGAERATLIDLGLAKPTRGFDGDITHVPAALGTPAFMSPEQVTGTHPVDARTDIYAAAATYIALATGRTLFDERGAAILGAITEGRRLSVASVAPWFGLATRNTLERALAYDREGRQSTILQFASELTASFNRRSASTTNTQVRSNERNRLSESQRPTVKIYKVRDK